MRKEDLNKILDKYWSGETSLEDENTLREYYSNRIGSEEPASYLFQYFEDQRKQELTRDLRIVPKKQTHNFRLFLSIAASVVVLAFAYFTIVPVSSTVNNDYGIVEDPEEALQVTRDALALMSTKMTEGETAVIRNIQHFDKTFIFKQ